MDTEIFNKKRITTITNKKNIRETKQVREKVNIEGIENRSIIDVDVVPMIEKENQLNNKINYEGELELRFILSNSDLQVDNRVVKIPFNYTVEEQCGDDNINRNMEMEITNQDFIVQEGGVVNSNIDITMNLNSYRSANMNIIDEIQTDGEREAEDYSILMYIVKKDDTLWKIAKRFGSTVEDIVRINGIEDENKIYPDQKLFIPHYSKASVKEYA